jgi:hypothetical protein
MTKYTFLPYNNIIKVENDYIVCEISFQKIAEVLNEELFNKPLYQIDINEDNINSMIEDYKKNPKFWSCKKNIILSYFKSFDEDESYYIYLMDGQHRLEMAKELYEKYNIDGSFYLYYYFVKNNEEMKELFISINKDSYKNHTFINIPELEKNIYEEYKNYLEKNYKQFFAKKISNKNQLYTISEFVNKIINHNIDIYNLDKINNKYNKVIGYKSLYLQDENKFYKEEKDILMKDIYYTFGFKNNTFIDYIINKNNNINHIKFKKIKDKISQNLRQAVWFKEFSSNTEGLCPIINCTNKIFLNIKNGFHCGHIISESNNGLTNIDNLRPLCYVCNLKMGSKNWNDYKIIELQL